MRAHFAQRLRSSSLNAVPPPQNSPEYSITLAKVAASVLYRSPLPSKSGLPIFVLNSAALPDAQEADYDALLPYVLARLPGEEELLTGTEYEVVFFAGAGGDGTVTSRKERPGWVWFIQAYHVLSRAMRKRIQKLYIVHEKAWVRVLVEMFSTIVSPKFRRKIFHVSTLTSLALHLPIEELLIPPTAYLHDRRLVDSVTSPYGNGRRAFSVRQPLPLSSAEKRRLPRVLRETTNFLLLEANIKTEGLFRIPPHSRLKDILREAYDRGQRFIVWKDYEASLPLNFYGDAEGLDVIIEEVDQKDAYGVQLATGIIKSWYQDLRQPIFPQSIYRDLKSSFGDVEESITLEKLLELISPKSEWSTMPALSREIVCRHLLPLLHRISERRADNKMGPENLSVCFAATLLCGPDQLEDAKMSSIIRRVLRAAIEAWENGLREGCGIDADSFDKDMEMPRDARDFEDPLEHFRKTSHGGEEDREPDEQHFTGIILKDNDSRTEMPPPLPPRAQQSSSHTVSGSGDDGATRRKPAPPLSIPPRYSTVISDASSEIAESPTSYAATTDGFAPPRSSLTADTTSPSSEKNGTTGARPLDSIPPRRKALTSEQIDNVERNAPSNVSRRVSKDYNYYESNIGVPLPALAMAKSANRVPHSGSQRSASNSDSHNSHPHVHSKAASNSPWHDYSRFEGNRESRPCSNQPEKHKNTTVNQEISTPAQRAPKMYSLARPEALPTQTPGQALRSTTLPVPNLRKPRTPSPGLLKRMPSFESVTASATHSFNEPVDPPPPRPPHRSSNTLHLSVPPRKLHTKKPSVEDLRRLYEERASAANTLVHAGFGREK